MIYRLYINALAPRVRYEDSEFENRHFLGKSESANWVPPRYVVVNRNAALRDMLMGSFGAPVVTETFRDAMASVLGKAVEFLPLGRLKGKDIFVLNVTRVVDCLDSSNSDIAYFPSEPVKIMRIRKYAFVLERCDHLSAFKIPQDLHSIFVNRAFCDAVVGYRLTGIGVDDPGEIRLTKGKCPVDGLPT